MREAAKQKLLARKCGTHECVCCSANWSHKCLCYTHTYRRHTPPHSERERGKEGRKCIGARCERASQTKTNDANTFSLPKRQGRQRKKSEKKNKYEFFLAHWQFLPACCHVCHASSQQAGAGGGCCRWKLSIRNVNANLMLEKFA